jgi:alginate O-acetyltransferase complex protein AlgI
MLLYVTFFPQLIAGPIVKYHDINMQMDERRVTIDGVAGGIRRFIIGLSKKLILADTSALVVDSIFAMNADEISGYCAWLGAILYIFQIYFDFSGYSDMAIGLAKMFGFDLLENFNYPYISKSITEFWRRWHISLSTWFREYLYIPLGGNRKGNFRTFINLFLVFIATGIWHGANFTFLIWGIYNGVLIVLERCKFINIKNRVFSHIYTIFAVIIGFVIFRADNLKFAVSFIIRMFSVEAFSLGGADALEFMTPYFIFIIICSIIACIPVLSKIKQLKEKNEKLYKFLDNCSYIVAFLLFVICFGVLASNSYSPFIYFRF